MTNGANWPELHYYFILIWQLSFCSAAFITERFYIHPNSLYQCFSLLNNNVSPVCPPLPIHFFFLKKERKKKGPTSPSIAGFVQKHKSVWWHKGHQFLVGDNSDTPTPRYQVKTAQQSIKSQPEANTVDVVNTGLMCCFLGSKEILGIIKIWGCTTGDQDKKKINEKIENIYH